MPRKLIEPDYWRIPKDRVKLLRADSVTGPGGTKIYFSEFPIIKYTPSGAWISEWGRERFVNLRAVKQFASTTKEYALDQLRHRKCRQIQIIEYQLMNAKVTLELLASGKLETPYYSDVEFY